MLGFMCVLVCMFVHLYRLHAALLQVKCVCVAGGRTLPWWSAVPDSVFQAVEGTSTFFALVIIVAFGLDSGRVGKGG